MKTISLAVDEQMDAKLAAVCTAQGRSKTEVVAVGVRKYLESQRLKRTLQDPALAELYRQLAAEDVALGEEGISEYQHMLQQANKT